jgi:UrcA family protein
MHALFTTLALSTLVAATPAAAQAGAEPFSVTIAYGDLNVVSDAGVEALLGRVKATANNVCAGVGDSILQQQLQAQQCRANFKRAVESKLWNEVPAGGMRIGAR